VTEPERYFFCHLQKTGGTSLQMGLRRHFGPNAVYPLPEHRKDVRSQIDVDFLREVFAEKGDQIRVVTGHFPLCTTEVLGVPFRSFTVLREPVERTLSFLRHQERLEPRWAGVPFDEAYGHPQTLHGLIENHMVKMLGLTAAEMTRGALTMTVFDDGHLARAKAALDAMDVVGLQQDLPAFYRALERRFGWSLGDVLRVNTTEASPPVDAFVERIRRDNALDLELYRYAVELVQARERAAAG
jgi:Sulfotransferase family